jgi:hypothetical protein
MKTQSTFTCLFPSLFCLVHCFCFMYFYELMCIPSDFQACFHHALFPTSLMLRRAYITGEYSTPHAKEFLSLLLGELW